jgi:hypothetical protein
MSCVVENARIEGRRGIYKAYFAVGRTMPVVRLELSMRVERKPTHKATG